MSAWKLRVLIDARHIRDFGFGTYTRNLLRSLARVDRKNEYLVVSHKTGLREMEGLPANFRRVLYERTDDSWADHITFPWLVRGHAPDVTHIPLNVVPVLLPKPYIVTVHDLSSLIYEKKEGWRHQLHLARVRRGLQRAFCVLAVSNATSRDLQGLLAVPSSQIRRIYGAADASFTESAATGPGANQSRLMERYQVNYPFLLYSGTIRPQKNIPRMVEAFALVKREMEEHPLYRDLRLIIIGDEISKYPAVRQAVIQARIAKDVRFLGFVPRETLRAFYESAVAFVFPSLYEGFGLPPLEAMACGTPVVCSDSTSLPEVVGDAAVMVNPENVFDIARGIREVLLDEDLRIHIRKSGFARLKAFSWDRTATEVLAAYTEAAAARV